MKKYRKFKEHEPHKDKQSSKKAVYTWIIAGLMIFSVAGFTIMDSSQQSKFYKGIKFKLEDQKWITKIGKQKFSFYFFPEEVDYISKDKIDIADSRMVYLTFDPNQKYLQVIDLVRLELANNFLNLDIYTIEGTTSPSAYNLPIITCSNATNYIPVLELRESNETTISVENNCIILKSRSEQDFIKLKDLLLYKILGITE